jgi:hypothetical protein
MANQGYPALVAIVERQEPALRMPKNASPLIWPTRSTEATLWHGQVDHLYTAFHTGIDMQGEPGGIVRSVSNGRVAFAGSLDCYGNTVAVDFIFDDAVLQARHAHLDSEPEFEVGELIAKGSSIGAMRLEQLEKGLLEISLFESTDGESCDSSGSNAAAVDPLLCIDRPSGSDLYLMRPMAASIDDGGGPAMAQQGRTLRGLSSWEKNERHLKNYDLDQDMHQAYLRKLVAEYISGDDINIDEVLAYSDSDAVATVTLNERTVHYGVGLGNAINRNDRLIVNLYDFWVDFEGDIDNSNELASPEYISRLKSFCNSKRENVSNAKKIDLDRNLTWMAKREVERCTYTDEISDTNWRELCYAINDLVIESEVFCKEIHYFRNVLNRVSESLEALNNENDFPFNIKWKLAPGFASIYHKYGPECEYNKKYLSFDHMYEAVYNKNGNLLTDDGGWGSVNMGTYNYAYSLNYLLKHKSLDVEPWKLWRNSALDQGHEVLESLEQ